MAATVGDLSSERLSELAYYLNGFSPSHPGDELDPPQYWELMAEYLRKEDRARFSSYTNQCLADMNAMLLLQDLARKRILLTDLKQLLKRIKCDQALNIFEAATKPTIRRQPAANVDVIEGHHIALEVEAKCHPGPPIYQWFKAESNDKNPVVGQNKSVLLINNASVANSGYYICRVTNPKMKGQEGVTFSNYVYVTVLDKKERASSNPRVVQEVGDRIGALTISTPEIVRHPAPTTARLSKPVELECLANGATVFDWYKDDKLFRQTNRTGKLVIENVTQRDGGMYHCVAIGGHGGKAASEKAKLTVDVGIKIKKQPEDVVVKVNEKFHLSCTATNDWNKELKYEWFQIQANGDHGHYGEGSDFVGVASAKRSVVWKFYCKVSLRDNPGVCKTSQTAKVKVKTVWIVAEPKSVKNFIGNRAMLNCRAEGLGPIDYRWFKSDTKGGKAKMVRHGLEWYVIERLGQAHWGYYFCQAENEFENALSRVVRVRALLPSEATLARQAKRTQQQPVIKIKRQPWNHVVPVGGRFRLLFEAVSSGDEPLQYQWHFSGKPIPGATSSEFIREKVEFSDYGSYWCLVSTKSSIQPAISNTARVEQSAEPIRGRGLASRSGNIENMKAEMEMITLKKERFAREKVALLIGNQRYKADELNDLRSPEGDIRALSRDLENLGFKVISLVNLHHKEIMNALEVFYQMLAVPGVYALFYYSGHGFQIPSGRNYIVPVDATMPLDLEHNIHVDGIIRNMQQKFSRAVVILDCCRSVVDNVIPDERLASGSLTSLEHEGVLNIANYVEISSCVDNFTAEDYAQKKGASLSSPTSLFPKPAHSFFNSAFRRALEKKKSIADVHQEVLNEFIADGRDQRPQLRILLADKAITFHDVVMMDDPLEHEQLLDEIRTTYDLAQAVPNDIILEGEEHLGHDLASLVRLEVSFRNEFSNVLCLVTKLVLLQNDMKTTTIKIEYDLEFIKKQFVRKDDVVVEQGMCLMNSEPLEQSTAEEDEEEEEEGGQGEYESFFVTSLRLFNIQRPLLSKVPKLKFFLTVTVGTEGVDKEGKVDFEVPLTTHLLNKNN